MDDARHKWTSVGPTIPDTFDTYAPKPRAGPVKYTETAPPYVRNAVEKQEWARVQLENKILQKKLRTVAREPPCNFHAVSGYKSLKEGEAQRKNRNGKAADPMAGRAHHVPVTAWPPTKAGLTEQRYPKEQARAITIENQFVQKKLQDSYKVRKDSFCVQHGMSAGLDCNERWATRTSMYADGPAKAARRPASASRVDRDISTNFGAAICSGCRSQRFSGADGRLLHPCRYCKRVMYCSDLCAQVDWLSHKHVCTFNTSGKWTPGGQRPREEYWVGNRAMGIVRKELRRIIASGTVGEGHEEQLAVVDALNELYRVERKKEVEAEKKQAHIEWRADYGMDGPRPCMCEDGELINGRKKKG